MLYFLLGAIGNRSMHERWNAMCEVLKAFGKRVDDDRVIAREIIMNLPNQFLQFIEAPDLRRIRVYDVGVDPNDCKSCVEQFNYYNAIKQTPDGRWVFGMGLVVGSGPVPDFQLAWPVFITVVDNSAAVEVFHKKIDMNREANSYNYKPLCEFMYNSLLESFRASASVPSVPNIGFLTR